MDRKEKGECFLCVRGKKGVVWAHGREDEGQGLEEETE